MKVAALFVMMVSFLTIVSCAPGSQKPLDPNSVIHPLEEIKKMDEIQEKELEKTAVEVKDELKPTTDSNDVPVAEEIVVDANNQQLVSEANAMVPPLPLNVDFYEKILELLNKAKQELEKDAETFRKITKQEEVSFELFADFNQILLDRFSPEKIEALNNYRLALLEKPKEVVDFLDGSHYNRWPLSVSSADHNFLFERGFVQITFSGYSLVGDYGQPSASARTANRSQHYNSGHRCFVKTPDLAIYASALVDVKIDYDVDFSAMVFPGKGCEQHDVFHLSTLYSDAYGRMSSEKIVYTVADIAPSEEVDYPGFTTFRECKAQTTENHDPLQQDLDFPSFVKDFSVRLCSLGLGIEQMSVNSLQLSIHHGANEQNDIFPKVTRDLDPQENLLHCQLTGPLATACMLQPKEIVSSVSHVQNFRLKYFYDCIGEPFSIVAETNSQEMMLQRSNAVQEVSIPANGGALKLKMKEPSFDFASFVLPNCSFYLIEAVSEGNSY